MHTQGEFIQLPELVVVPGGDEDVHRVSDHGEVGGPAAAPHHTADPRVVKPGDYDTGLKLDGNYFIYCLSYLA